MNERISALLDGELSGADCAECIDRVRSGEEHRRIWDTYVLIGDGLRGHLGPDCAAAVATRLRSEPTVLAPRSPRRGRAQHPAWPALAMAAGVAVVALVAWVMLPQGRVEAPIASSNVPMPASAAAPSLPAGSAPGVDNYLLAHQRFSPSLALQGVAPYVRTVSQDLKR